MVYGSRVSPREKARLAGALVVLYSATAPAKPLKSDCSERHGTAVGQVACELARGLPQQSARVIVVPAAVETALPAERLEQLAQQLATLLVGEIGPQARVAQVGITGQHLAGLASRGWRVILVKPRLEPDRLSAVADELSSIPRFWERLRKVTPGARAHVFASRPLDAELRSFLPPIPLILSRVDKNDPLDEPSLALACGDVDADGSHEIVSVGRRRIQLGRIQNGKFLVKRALAWSDLTEVAPRPLREPLASAVLRAPGALEVGLSDRATAIRFDASLDVIARYPERVPWPGGGCAHVGPVALGATRVPCEASLRAAHQSTEEHVDAVAGVRLTAPDGKVHEFIARRRQKDARLELQAKARWILLTEPTGAQIALGDLNGDGEPELISSNDTRDAKLDFVRVQTLERDGSQREAFRLSVPAGVHALAVCPAQGVGLSPVVLATGEGLWLLR